MAKERHYDFIVIGGGMVGLSVVHQLKKRDERLRIAVIEKEAFCGMHSSGRNSGVLHAGLYYKPDSLKARVCVNGAKKLKKFVAENQLEINNCGKIIVPTSENLDSQLNLLAERGRKNGARVEFIDDQQLKELIPCARSASGRALWSPDTSVVDPKQVLKCLVKTLEELNVPIFTGCNWDLSEDQKCINFSTGHQLTFDYLINCAGLYADRIAHQFGVDKQYSLIPFKGIYWEIKSSSSIQINHNLYPVPDLSVPFLGVHFTPNVTNTKLYIGPTATLAFGRENYTKLEGFEPVNLLENLRIICDQYFYDRGGFRGYVHEQAFLSLTPLMLKQAKRLVPSLTLNDLKKSQKVGIRPQLFNKQTKSLENDFLCVKAENSLHVLNAISPAFTASFSLADLILEDVFE